MKKLLSPIALLIILAFTATAKGHIAANDEKEAASDSADVNTVDSVP